MFDKAFHWRKKPVQGADIIVFLCRSFAMTYLFPNTLASSLMTVDVSCIYAWMSLILCTCKDASPPGGGVGVRILVALISLPHLVSLLA